MLAFPAVFIASSPVIANFIDQTVETEPQRVAAGT